jgi:large subunit ribosomal protein L18
MKFSKEGRRKKIHRRVRSKIQGSPAKPRICVFRSNKSIYCQLIDDVAGHTLAAASSFESDLPQGATKTEKAKAVGKILAERALAKNITSAVFDRGGYLYHGRVKSLADGAREGGLQF